MGLLLCKVDREGERVESSTMRDSQSSVHAEIIAVPEERRVPSLAPRNLDLNEVCTEDGSHSVPCESVAESAIGSQAAGAEKEQQQEEPQQELQPDYSVHDSLGVPWYEPSTTMERKVFIQGYFTHMVPSPDDVGYVTQRGDSGQLQYTLSSAGAKAKDTDHPPPMFSRRTTLNTFLTALMDSLFISGLRLAVLQANLQVFMAMLDNRTYDDARNYVWVGAIALAVAVVLWVILSAIRAYKYRQFIHPDTRMKRFVCYTCSTLLCMFAIPNDLFLAPIHILPVEKGGLCTSVDLVEGCQRWPVFTIAHPSKPDHDYTNSAGLTVQLPLFVIVDIGCTALHVTIAVQHGLLNISAFIQMCLCFAYAVIKLSEALRRMLVRRQLLDIWLRTAADPRMPPRMQFMAMNKYIAEGGNKRRLEQDLRKSSAERLSDRMPNREWAKRSTAVGVLLGVPEAQLEEVVKEFPSVGDVTDHNVEDVMHVPWYRSSKMRQSVSSMNRLVKFVDSFYIDREVQPDGKYGPKMQENLCEYKIHLASKDVDHYPPPYYYRRLTLNTWSELLASAVSEAALRNAGLLATIMMAVMMIENPLYETMNYSLWAAFISMLSLGLLLWCLTGFAVKGFLARFVHPDSKWAHRRALLGVCVVAIFSIPADVNLLLLHLLPTSKGGLSFDSTCIEGNRAWPVHSIVHQSRLDHDYVNTQLVFLQLPLFLLVDIGCTCVNLAIALDVGVFNYTTLLQMCTSGTYAFIKVYKISRQLRTRKKLLPVWLRMSADPHLAEHKRQQAMDKYAFAKGNKKAMAKARKEAGLPSPNPRGRASGSIDSM